MPLYESSKLAVKKGNRRIIQKNYAYMLQGQLSKTKCLVSSTRASGFVSTSGSSSSTAVAVRRHEPNPTFSKQISTYCVQRRLTNRRNLCHPRLRGLLAKAQESCLSLCIMENVIRTHAFLSDAVQWRNINRGD